MAVTQVIDYRIRCDHTSCARQCFIAAESVEQAARKAVVSFGWQGTAKRIHCPEHKAASDG